MATQLPLLTVHTDEILPIEFAPETHGVSRVVEWGDGKRLVYVGPLEELEKLVNPTGVNENQ